MGLYQRGEIASLVGLSDAGDDALQVAINEALERRTAEHAQAASTTEAEQMSHAPIDRALTDEERQLLADLAVRELAEQAGCTLQEANDVLAEMAGGGELLFVGDAETVRVTNTRGGWLVHCARDWLAFHATWPGHDPWKDRK